jgi:hypothetical protein
MDGHTQKTGGENGRARYPCGIGFVLLRIQNQSFLFASVRWNLLNVAHPPDEGAADHAGCCVLLGVVLVPWGQLSHVLRASPAQQAALPDPHRLGELESSARETVPNRLSLLVG